MKKIRFKIFIFCLIIFLPLSAKAVQPDFVLKFNGQTYEVDSKTFDSWKGYSPKIKSNLLTSPPLGAQEALNGYFGREIKNFPALDSYKFKPEKIYEFIAALSEKINRDVQEPKITIENNRAVEFSPPQNGQTLDVFASAFLATEALESEQKEALLFVAENAPKTKLSDLNSLGINELLAEGKSNFKGSPKNRRHNIKIGVGKFAGVIIKPGEDFSFNKYLGPVEKDQGFLPELVIKKDGTVPELGGGLCQVSSTTFRAVMNAGLPVLQRKNHAYAVQYYSPQGTDATIYPGVVDLKFKNDTQGSILIWPYFTDNDNLTFDFYGTKDSRVVDVKKPIQYDRKTDGSMKAEWTRVVTKDGVTSTSTFKSIYQSPALFHKEEKFVTAAPTPTPTPTTQIN